MVIEPIGVQKTSSYAQSGLLGLSWFLNPTKRLLHELGLIQTFRRVSPTFSYGTPMGAAQWELHSGNCKYTHTQWKL